jgi:lipopolysaccharide/colanic/teichoic acid biosynthesis glycosyltransferase
MRDELQMSLETSESQIALSHEWYLPLKATWEWIAALILFIATVPLMFLLAILVRMTSPGPAFYSQSRVGRNGRIFLMHKLRTMHHQCETKTGPIWSPPNDSRITRVGRFLRKTHLDELPQLLNILQGHMALIGPRPERPELCAVIQRTIPKFHERLRVRPGMTGLAQTQLPADLGMHTVHKKLAYDLFYVREVNPWLDMRIALSTLLYLCGVVLHMVGRRMVSPYGMAAERDHHANEEMSEEKFETPTT